MRAAPITKILVIAGVLSGVAILLGVTGVISLGAAIAIVIGITILESAMIVRTVVRAQADRTPGDDELDELAQANPGMDFSPENDR